MEPAITALLELAAPLLMTLSSAFTDLTLSAWALIAIVILALLVMLGLLAAKTKKPDRSSSPGAEVQRRPWGRRLLIAASSLLLIVLTATITADRFFFEPAARWMFSLVEKRTGLTVVFDRAEGSLLAGQFRFTNLRAGHDALTHSILDLTIGQAEIDISLIELITRKIGIGSPKSGGDDGNIKPERVFVINSLSLDGVKLNYTLPPFPGSQSGEMNLDHLRAGPVSSDYFIRDILFRGQVSGSVNGQKFNMVNQDRPDGEFISGWRSDNVPIGSLASLVGGPLSWIESGLVDIAVDNQGRRDGEAAIMMNWRLAFHDLKARTPDEASLTARMRAAAFAAYVNSKGGNFDLSFPVEVGPEGIKFAGADELSALILSKVKAGLKELGAEKVKTLEGPAGQILETLKQDKRDKETGSRNGGRLRSLLQRKDSRQPSADK